MKRSGKSIVLFPVLLAIAVMLLSGIALAGVRTQVIVNKSVLVNLKNPAERVSIANPAIADLLLITPRQIQLNGLALGATSLIVWEKGGEKPLFFDVNVVGNTNIDDSQQVLLQVKVAQIDKTALKNLGVSFLVKNQNANGFSNMIGAPSTSSTSASGDGTISTANGIIDGFSSLNPYTMGITHFPSGVSAVIKALATKGMAKILAEPNLVVKSGQKGEFFAGSRIPFSVLENTGSTSTPSIRWEEVGVKLNFKPFVMESGTIALELDPVEVSNIQGTLETNGYPVIDTRTIKTSAELRDGESLVLAGLLRDETYKSISKVPLLGDIPILGALFRTTENEQKETELVFFITPKLVMPEVPGVKVELPTDKQLTPEQEKEFQWIPMTK
ncbi:type II and III secretion system protein family protein [Pelobacter propionicus]|uniref:Type II and III secretion system protein n=1 Tax=Pelobacter propionicus (strain DSM 2379 / NBRC 103807 / OttBd1) TaxID=338966 RepID=A1ASI5_PELPD|nr:pilus assembly protein N-terminal domain-containing protein [Pelobacter propionicus]ABL00306.1 type II and III secretion system protein [Pelobacter propionicus DSM 2379]